MAYNTGKPVPSRDPRDLIDNAESFDIRATSRDVRSTPDRLGISRKTWYGMEQDFADFLARSGFEPVHLIYQDGVALQVDRPTQMIDYSGSVYRVKMPASFPVMLSGTWATDSAQLVDVGDQSLRQLITDHTDPSKGAAAVGRATVAVASISDLQTAPRGLGLHVSVAGYYAGTSVGGGVFRWDAASVAGEDGGTVFAVAGVPVGRWMRLITDLTTDDFGLQGATVDNTAGFTAAVIAASTAKRTLYVTKVLGVAAATFESVPDIRLRGPGGLRLLDGVNLRVLRFTNCDNLDIEGIEIDGNKYAQTATSQIVSPDAVGGLCITTCENWRVEKCNIHDVRLGAAVLIVDNGTNSSTNWGGSLQNGKLLNNYIHLNGVSGVVFCDGVFAWSHSTLIKGNVIRECTDYGIACDYSERSKYLNNVISGCLVAIGVLGVDDCEYAGNDIKDCDLGIAVTLSGNAPANPFVSRNVKIHDNNIANISGSTTLGDGIFVDPSAEHVEVYDNTTRACVRGAAVASPTSSLRGHRDYDPTSSVGIYTDCKDGQVYDNTTEYTAGGVPPKQVNLGAASKRINGARGVQEEVFWVSSSTASSDVCDVIPRDSYAAGILNITVAGLFASYGAFAVTRSYKIANSNGALSSTLLWEHGDTAQLLTAVTDATGKLRLTFAQGGGGATDAAVHVSLKSFSAGDSVFHLSAIV